MRLSIDRYSLYQITAICLCILPLQGCFERHKTTDRLCQEKPQLCHDLNIDDGQCRIQRTNLIWQRNRILSAPTDIERLQELKDMKKYQLCLEFAAQIEPIDMKERKTYRIDKLHQVYQSEQKLMEQLLNSYDPNVLYYRWTQGSQDALEQFLKQKDSEQVKTTTLQFGYAAYYSQQKNSNKAKQHLLAALSYLEPNEAIQPQLIQGLATYAFQENNLIQAYIWTRTGQQLKLFDVSDQRMEQHFSFSSKEISTLDKVVDKVVNSLLDGNFEPALLIVPTFKNS
ncbi:DUF2989 domain-containing protein [Photobacterium damselae]|uniref:DUF2989 domain-containing protein n=1 Tax=Photobacterium damselae TaxID=38293 RepID=UPI0035A8E556